MGSRGRRTVGKGGGGWQESGPKVGAEGTMGWRGGCRRRVDERRGTSRNFKEGGFTGDPPAAVGGRHTPGGDGAAGARHSLWPLPLFAPMPARRCAAAPPVPAPPHCVRRCVRRRHAPGAAGRRGYRRRHARARGSARGRPRRPPRRWPRRRPTRGRRGGSAARPRRLCRGKAAAAAPATRRSRCSCLQPGAPPLCPDPPAPHGLLTSASSSQLEPRAGGGQDTRAARGPPRVPLPLESRLAQTRGHGVG